MYDQKKYTAPQGGLYEASDNEFCAASCLIYSLCQDCFAEVKIMKVADEGEVCQHGIQLVRVEVDFGEGEGGELLVETDAVEGGAIETTAREVDASNLRVGDPLHHLHGSRVTQVCVGQIQAGQVFDGCNYETGFEEAEVVEGKVKSVSPSRLQTANLSQEGGGLLQG